ncbi:hypothetical protein HDU79_010924 [Rhizoclosmatium sp. JEL0117]|nr:hypothetical protein HDU79_010924 [Rhizoclosmatium sp. JEL0117]
MQPQPYTQESLHSKTVAENGLEPDQTQDMNPVKRNIVWADDAGNTLDTFKTESSASVSEGGSEEGTRKPTEVPLLLQPNINGNQQLQPEANNKIDDLMDWRMEKILGLPGTRSSSVYTYNQKTDTWSSSFLLLLAQGTDASGLFLCVNEKSRPLSLFRITSHVILDVGEMVDNATKKILYVWEVKTNDRVWRIATDTEERRNRWCSWIYDAVEMCKKLQPSEPLIEATQTTPSETETPTMTRSLSARIGRMRSLSAGAFARWARRTG